MAKRVDKFEKVYEEDQANLAPLWRFIMKIMQNWTHSYNIAALQENKILATKVNQPG